MQKSLLLTVLVTFCVTSFGQDFSELSNYNFDSVQSYEVQESNVLVCANYLFNNPSDKDKLARLVSTQFIFKWMYGTPDYDFTIDEKAMELTKGNDELFGLYTAAMTKVVLDNKDEKLTDEEVYNKAKDILVDYCSEPSNKMKPSKKIKKILKNRK